MAVTQSQSIGARNKDTKAPFPLRSLIKLNGSPYWYQTSWLFMVLTSSHLYKSHRYRRKQSWTRNSRKQLGLAGPLLLAIDESFRTVITKLRKAQGLVGNIYGIFPQTMSTRIVKLFYYCRLLAQTSLRNILGTKNLHEILSDRESISIAMQVLFINNSDW